MAQQVVVLLVDDVDGPLSMRLTGSALDGAHGVPQH